MELEKTVNLMVNGDFADRLVAEYEQLIIRMQKLDVALADQMYREAYGEENVKLLEEQYNIMSQYEDVLYRRAQNYGIELPTWEELGYGE